MRPIFLLSLLFTLSASIGIGCGTPTTPNNTNNNNTNELTYHKDIKPLLDKHCVSCHAKGQLAPFPLTSFQFVQTYKAQIKDSVKSRRMPPWQADNACNEYQHNISLKDDEIKKFADWVDKGAKEGSASASPAPKDEAPAPPAGLPRVDLKLKLKTPYKQGKFPDDYRCFVIDWTEANTKYITGFQVNPGNKATVHHAILFLASPAEAAKFAELDAKEEGEGYTCYGGVGAKSSGWLGAWAPGSPGAPYPAGTGIKIQPGSKVIIQMHYNSFKKDPDTDQTEIHLMLADKVEKEARLIPFTNPLWTTTKTMKIPQGDAAAKHQFSFDIADRFKQKFKIHNVSLHMHTLGKSATIFVKKSNGSEQCLLNIPRWDFNWQRSYLLQKPYILEPGEELGIRCTWDNSQKNQPYAEGKQLQSRDVFWGEGTTDEMCLGVMYVTFENL